MGAPCWLNLNLAAAGQAAEAGPAAVVVGPAAEQAVAAGSAMEIEGQETVGKTVVDKWRLAERCARTVLLGSSPADGHAQQDPIPPDSVLGPTPESPGLPQAPQAKGNGLVGWIQLVECMFEALYNRKSRAPASLRKR